MNADGKLLLSISVKMNCCLPPWLGGKFISVNLPSRGWLDSLRNYLLKTQCQFLLLLTGHMFQNSSSKISLVRSSPCSWPMHSRNPFYHGYSDHGPFMKALEWPSIEAKLHSVDVILSTY